MLIFAKETVGNFNVTTASATEAHGHFFLNSVFPLYFLFRKLFTEPSTYYSVSINAVHDAGYMFQCLLIH
jgi:hypothetical protein